jgi:hypothetical protein
MAKGDPRLRTVIKSVPAFPLNEFPADLPQKLGRELVYLLATKTNPTLEGAEWEAIFADCIGAKWKPSNAGLDDIVLGNTAWGAKTVKIDNPLKATRVRLISGRNSLSYSFGNDFSRHADPNETGEQVLDIWNERVSGIREHYKHLRTVVLMKSPDLTEAVLFEFETIRYDPELFKWEFNSRGNLEGKNKKTGIHHFTWQPSGSQFTIIEDMPSKLLHIQVKAPATMDKEVFLNRIGFDKTWVTVDKIIRP